MKLKVSGHENLVRDMSSNAIINTNVTEYKAYLLRVKNREKQSDMMRDQVNEINSLKQELREIKKLIVSLGKK